MDDSLGYSLRRFKNMLKLRKAGGTEIYEVQSCLIKNVRTVKSILNKVPINSVIWQHTPELHVAAITLEKGSGYNYSRRFYELIHKGIDSPTKFKKAWLANTLNIQDDEIPNLKGTSFTGNSRKKAKLFIVADTAVEYESQFIEGSLEQNSADRTHLIPFTAIGIDNNPGIMIDYDSWLNRNPMQQFEDKILKLNEYRTITWITSVYGNQNGLNWKYLIYDTHSDKLIDKAHWVDDRWKYYWYTTSEQQTLFDREISKEGEV